MTPLDRPVPRTLRSQPLFPLTVAWLALGLSAGCGSGGPGGRGGQVGDPCDASRPCRSDLVCGTNGMCVVDEPPPDQGVVVLPDLGPGVTITGIELTPVGETADLTIGATDTVQFSAVLRRSDSQTLPATGARFTASSRVLGTLDTVTGAFALNGLLGGSVTVTVSITIGGQTFTDTETLVVNLSRTIGGGAGGPTDPVTQFMGTPRTVGPGARRRGPARTPGSVRRPGPRLHEFRPARHGAHRGPPPRRPAAARPGPGPRRRSGHPARPGLVSRCVSETKSGEIPALTRNGEAPSEIHRSGDESGRTPGRS